MNKNAVIREMQGFLFYSRLIWPAHRKLARKIITPRCRKCIISANCVPLDHQGLCTQCREQPLISDRDQPSNASRVDDLSAVLDAHSGKASGQHDAAILFSGGKDSSYMVHRIREAHPKLRIMLLTIDNTFMSPIAMQNVDALVKKFDLDHLVIRAPARIYEKMFRHAFLHLNEKGCSGTVDQFDGDFLHDVARNWAARCGIPLLLSGCSRTQVERILGLNHYEFPAEFERSRREQIAGIKLRDVFNEDEMGYWMNEGAQQGLARPRLLFPFYVWDVDETEILNSVSRWGLLPPSAKNPLLTNNQLIPLMVIVDMVKFGYSSFEPEFCQMVRRGKADPIFWRNVFELSEYSAKTGRFISQSVDAVLSRLKLSRREIGIPDARA